MKNLKAVALMGAWTLSVGFALYLLQAHLHYRDVVWALGIAAAVLGTHMVNMAIYFRIAGDTPYQWFRE
ncbi:MAG: hypothetical protein AB8F65_14250 [Woeseiaceae bacterium]